MGVPGNLHSSLNCDQLVSVGENGLVASTGSPPSSEQCPKVVLFL